jgi:hypothetical protein
MAAYRPQVTVFRGDGPLAVRRAPPMVGVQMRGSSYNGREGRFLYTRQLTNAIPQAAEI